MNYIYIELKPGKTNDFTDILYYNKTPYDHVSYSTIILCKDDFNLLYEFLGRDLISSFASKILSL